MLASLLLASVTPIVIFLKWSWTVWHFLRIFSAQHLCLMLPLLIISFSGNPIAPLHPLNPFFDSNMSNKVCSYMLKLVTFTYPSPFAVCSLSLFLLYLFPHHLP